MSIIGIVTTTIITTTTKTNTNTTTRFYNPIDKIGAFIKDRNNQRDNHVITDTIASHRRVSGIKSILITNLFLVILTLTLMIMIIGFGGC